MTETMLSPAFHPANLDAHGSGRQWCDRQGTQPLPQRTERAAAAMQHISYVNERGADPAGHHNRHLIITLD